MKFLLFTVFLLLPSFLNAQSQTHFSKSEVLQDLNTLREVLLEAHYNVFTYTSKREFNSSFKKARKSVTSDSLSKREALNVFSSFISVVKNGHTNLNQVPVYIEYAYAGGTLFPIEIAFEDGKPLIRKNWSDDKSIEIGSEILSINGTKIEAILEQMYPLVPAERMYFKHAKMEAFSFPRLYWQLYGKVESFTVEIKKDGQTKSHSFDAINLIEGYETVREDVLNAQMKLDFIEDVAYLNPGGFSGDESKYRRFIDSSFTEINKRNVENLIIDFRNNPGGDDSFSNYLASYLADKPFSWCSRFTLKTSQVLKDFVRTNYDTTESYWKSVLEHENGEIYEYDFEMNQPKPKDQRFYGNVFVLVNRQSHSQSTVAAAQFQDLDLATIVGEETGEYPSLLASIYQYSLPITGIEVNISKGFIERLNGKVEEKGVVPDIIIKDYLLDEKDEILEGLLKKIETK